MDLGLFSFRDLLLDLKRRQGLHPCWASCELELFSGVRTGRAVEGGGIHGKGARGGGLSPP